MRYKFGYDKALHDKHWAIGYFIRYCSCGEKFWITEQELIDLFQKTNVDFPILSIIWQRVLHRWQVPKFRLEIEWRKLAEIRKMPITRNQEIMNLRDQGWTFQKLGKRYGLTRQRIWAITHKS